MLDDFILPNFDSTQMVTKHSTYVSFHIHLPLDKLHDEPSFWPKEVMVKIFRGCFQIGTILNRNLKISKKKKKSKPP